MATQPIGHISPPSSDSDARLVRAAGAASASDEASSELHAAVCEYVAQLKAQRLPPERVVVAVKQALTRAGLPRYRKPLDVFLIERAVRWCIEEYYRG